MSDYYASDIPEYFGHRLLTAGEIAVVDRTFGGWAEDFNALSTECDGFTFSDHSVTRFAASAFLAGWAAARTTEPTDAEIEAGASEIESASDGHRAQRDTDGRYISCSCGSPVSCMEEFDMHWDREMAKACLEATRKTRRNETHRKEH